MKEAVGEWTRIATGSSIEEVIEPGADISGVLRIGERLEKIENQGEWLEWLYVPPVVPGIPNLVKLQDLDEALMEHIGALEKVCRDPRAHLRTTLERVDVSRARRMPPQGMSFLCSHTEDWEKRTRTGVVPRRLLAEVRDEELDIYENRVAVRLIDHLHHYLNGRMSELQSAYDQLDKLERLKGMATGARGLHTRTERVCELLAVISDPDKDRKAAESTIATIDVLQRRVVGLKQSKLYEAIPARSAVMLRLTNIFANDQDYRRIAVLWIEWLRSHQNTEDLPEERERRISRAFSLFCRLLVIRSLEQLRIEPVYHEHPESRLTRGFELDVAGRPRLTWSDGGLISLTSSSGREIARVIPWAVQLTTESSSSVEAGLQRTIVEFETQGRIPTLVMYLAKTGTQIDGVKEQQRPLPHTVGNEPGLGMPPDLGFIPVSPWQIDCVEKVARGLRWILTGRALLSYPAKARSPVPDALDQWRMPDWLRRSAGKLVEVIRKPTGAEMKAAGVQTRIRELEEEYESWDAQRALQRDKQSRHDRQQGHQRVLESQQRLASAVQFWSELEFLVSEHPDASICPICGCGEKPEAPERKLNSGDHGFYRYTCPGCRASWGTQICGSCRVIFPVLRPGNFFYPADRPQGWVDEIFGMDILSIPHDGRSFICPKCGRPS